MREHFLDAKFLTPLDAFDIGSDWLGLPEWANETGATRLLRTNTLKRPRETLDAALFCYGVEQLFQTPVHLSITEKEDFDFLVLIDPKGQIGSWQLQLKELPPEHIAPNASLDHLVTSLHKYKNPELTIAIKHSSRDSGVFTCQL